MDRIFPAAYLEVGRSTQAVVGGGGVPAGGAGFWNERVESRSVLGSFIMGPGKSRQDNPDTSCREGL